MNEQTKTQDQNQNPDILTGSSEITNQIQKWKDYDTVMKDTFQPKDSGAMNRLLYREKVSPYKAGSVSQMLYEQIKQDDDNANNYIYSRTVEFPQPSIAGIGAVTSAGAKDTTRYFFSQSWVTSRTVAGVYVITHNLGDNKYNVQVSPINTLAFTANISNYGVNTFQVSTFNAAGVATDCGFTFVVYIIP